MNKYLAVIMCSIQLSIAYRITYIINIAVSFVSIFFLLCLWDAVYAGQAVLTGFSWNQMKAYLLITFIINTEVYSEHRCSRKILDGSIGMDLVKPIRYQEYTLSEITGSIILSTILSAMICVFIFLSFGFYVPNNIFVWLTFFISMFFALLLKNIIIYLFSLCAFWTQNVTGIVWTRVAVTNFFSGALIPLSFFPEFLQKISYFLPFQGVINTPVLIYTMKVERIEMLMLVASQIGWILLFWFLAKGVFNMGIRKVVIHGG